MLFIHVINEYDVIVRLLGKEVLNLLQVKLLTSYMFLRKEFVLFNNLKLNQTIQLAGIAGIA